jgi:hypothetical protein
MVACGVGATAIGGTTGAGVAIAVGVVTAGVGVARGDGLEVARGAWRWAGVGVGLGSGRTGTTCAGVGVGVGVGVGTGIGIGERGAMVKLSRPGMVCGSWPLAGGLVCVVWASAGAALAASAITATRRGKRVLNGGKRIICPVEAGMRPNRCKLNACQPANRAPSRV